MSHLSEYKRAMGKNPETSDRVIQSLKDFRGTLPYDKNNRTIDIHFGQRKLFVSEVDFFEQTRQYWENMPNLIVLYIGSAAGTHINLISQMYPELTFHLYDEVAFDAGLRDKKNVVIYQEYFYKEQAERYDDKNVVFISDIRGLDIGQFKQSGIDNEKKCDEVVMRDNAVQVSVYQSLKNPIAGLFKFRLPYHEEKVKFFRGDIRLQCWNSMASTETRLIVIGKGKLTDYDCKEYEAKMHFFNIKKRFMVYPTSHLVNPYPCACLNCVREQEIFALYVSNTKVNGFRSVAELNKKISWITRKPLFRR